MRYFYLNNTEEAIVPVRQQFEGPQAELSLPCQALFPVIQVEQLRHLTIIRICGTKLLV